MRQAAARFASLPFQHCLPGTLKIITAVWTAVLTGARGPAVLQGHFQIILSRKYCPLFRRRLDWLSRGLYCSGVWSYIINALTTPIFMAVRRPAPHST